MLGSLVAGAGCKVVHPSKFSNVVLERFFIADGGRRGNAKS